MVLYTKVHFRLLRERALTQRRLRLAEMFKNPVED